MSPHINVPSDTSIRLYKKRWLMMVIFMWYMFTTSIHWIEFSSINNIITKYYKVSPTLVEWTTIMYMVAYVLLLFPGLFVMEKFGIRVTMMLASAGTCAGACIKVLCVAPDRFYILMLGQLFTAVSSIFNFGAVSRFTATWFGNDELSRAAALALFGDQVGNAMSFIIPTSMVHDNPDTAETEKEMLQLHRTVAAANILAFILILVFFRKEPKSPPSVAQARQKNLKTENIWKSVVEMITNRSFLLISLSYSLAVPVSNSIATLLNQLVLNNFSKDHTVDAGRIGGLYMITGMLSALISSWILDKTGKFKESAVILTACASISMALMTAALKSGSIITVYVTTAVLGYFLQGYYATGIQMCIEVTYPISENISTATMLLFSQIISIGVISLYGFAVKEYGDLISNIGMISILLTSSILACSIPPHLKRQNAESAYETVTVTSGDRSTQA